MLKELAQKDPLHVEVIVFRRNYGQTAAIAAGIDHSDGDIVILMDADMQNDPADIPIMLAKLDEGYDMVSGWRKDRKDPFLSRILPFANRQWLDLLGNRGSSSRLWLHIKSVSARSFEWVPALWRNASFYSSLCSCLRGTRGRDRCPPPSPEIWEIQIWA